MYRVAQLESSWGIGQPLSVLGLVFTTFPSGWEGALVRVEMSELAMSVTV